MAARSDLQRDHYIFLTFGSESPERQEIARLLRAQYGIDLRIVAAHGVSESLASYVRGYNEVMAEATSNKFGHDVYRECAEATIKAEHAGTQ
jgi:hypothetical protein